MSDATDTADFKVSLIRLADGTLIDPLTKEPINAAMQPKKNDKKVEEPEDEPEQVDEDDDDFNLDLRPATRRSIMDLALPKAQMAVINNILVYTVWGLPDDEIAIQCNCTVHQVRVVRDLDDYKRMYDALIDGLRSAYADTVHGIFAEAAPRMARGIVKKAKHKSADISLAAMKDALDRGGYRPVDKVEHTHNIGSGSELVIRVIKQNDSDAIPTLDLTPNA